MARLNKDHIDYFFDNDIWIEGRTLYVGAIPVHSLGDIYDADEISAFSAERLLKGLAILETKPDEPIKIIINSQGGDFYQGLAMYDAIRRSPCYIEILATGQCMSAASIILQAADKRVVSKSCVLMIHDGQDSLIGSPNDIKRQADFGMIHQQMMYQAYAEKSGKPSSYWKKKCQRDYYVTAEQAVAEGLADEVI